jgi:soluble lytic murein transglycosylase-like protein
LKSHLPTLATRRPRRSLAWGLVAALLVTSPAVLAGAQKYEPLSASVQAKLSKSIADRAAEGGITDSQAARAWVAEMSRRLVKRMPDAGSREDFLASVFYEASRAGLEPDLVMGLIEVESAFRKYAVSTAGARGFMQVMPFWVGLVGTTEHNLFHLRTNLRYGCTILRHYLDIEKGDLFRALGRYNGSLGQADYPTMVLAAWKTRWVYESIPGKQARAY